MRRTERPPEEIPREVLTLGLKAGNAIGDGLYGVDIKESGGHACVIEVNDNPSLESGEDAHYPLVYQKIVGHLLGA